MQIGIIVLKDQPDRYEKSWRIRLDDSREMYLPLSTIHGYEPATRKLRVEVWMLKQKAIKYKLK